MAISARMLSKMDLPAEHSGPYVIIELANQMLVKSVMHYDNFTSAVAGMTGHYLNHGSHRLIQESDVRWYLNTANTNYRSWWQNDVFVGPLNWRDTSDFPSLNLS